MTKEDKVKKLYSKGVTEPKLIAKKLGFTGGSLTAGIAFVNDTFRKLGLG